MTKTFIKKISKASSTKYYYKNIKFFEMLNNHYTNGEDIEIIYIKSSDIYFDLIELKNENGDKNIIPVPIVMEVLFNKWYNFQIVPSDKEMKKIYKVYYKILTSCHKVVDKEI